MKRQKEKFHKNQSGNNFDKFYTKIKPNLITALDFMNEFIFSLVLETSSHQTNSFRLCPYSKDCYIPLSVATILVQNQFAEIVYKRVGNDDCKSSCPVFHCKNSRVHR